MGFSQLLPLKSLLTELKPDGSFQASTMWYALLTATRSHLPLALISWLFGPSM